MKKCLFMKIYDCFTYYNESDIVEIRFEELHKVVDFFVVIEASETFTGVHKEYCFDQLVDINKKYKDKIIRIKINFPDKNMSPWEREFFQRNCVTEFLFEYNVLDDDIIILSDADEIPRASIVENISSYNLPTRLDVCQYFWNFNWKVPDHCNQGARPIVSKFSDIKKIGPQNLRAETVDMIPKAGWHFSFFGELEKVKNKIESFAHTEYDKDDYKDYINIINRVELGIDPFDRFPLKYHEIDNTYPDFVVRKYLKKEKQM